MNLNLTPAELKDLRWLLETVIADQEHFLDDETDPDARRDEGASIMRCPRQRVKDAPSERAQRGAEKLFKRLTSRRLRLRSRREPVRRVRVRVISTRVSTGDSELRLVPVLPTRTTARRQSGIDLVTLLNCAEADLFGYLEFIDVSAQDKEHSAAQTVRELHAALTRLQPQHTCPLSKWGGAP